MLPRHQGLVNWLSWVIGALNRPSQPYAKLGCVGYWFWSGSYSFLELHKICDKMCTLICRYGDLQECGSWSKMKKPSFKMILSDRFSDVLAFCFWPKQSLSMHICKAHFWASWKRYFFWNMMPGIWPLVKKQSTLEIRFWKNLDFCNHTNIFTW